MTPCKNKLDKFTLTELGELLSYYSVYDTTKKSGEDTRPSGPEFKKYLCQRLKELDDKTPKPTPKPAAVILLSLKAIERRAENLVIGINKELTSFLHNANPAIKRKPKEYAREIVLSLMEENFFFRGALTHDLNVQLLEGNYIPDPRHSVKARGIDWVIFQYVN